MTKDCRLRGSFRRPSRIVKPLKNFTALECVGIATHIGCECGLTARVKSVGCEPQSITTLRVSKSWVVPRCG